MKITTFASSLALAALLASGSAIAQGAATDLPPPLADAGLERVTVETKSDGRREIEGTLPDGTEIEAYFDAQDNLLKVEAEDGALPDALVEAALPQGLRGHPVLSQFARFDEIDRKPRETRIKGRQSDGRKLMLRLDAHARLTGIEADGAAISDDVLAGMLPQALRGSEVFAQFALIDEVDVEGDRFDLRGRDEAGARMRAQMDGTGMLQRFARDGERREERRGGREMRGPGGKQGQGQEGRPERGPRMGEGRKGGMPEGGPRGRAEGMGEGRGPGAGAAIEVDTAAISQRLTEAGYSGFGLLHQRGPRLSLQAVNPDGEAVTLELDPAGEVLRETAR